MTSKKQKINSRPVLLSVWAALCLLGACKNEGHSNADDGPATTTEGVQTVNYVPVSEVFPNPERGFYKQLDNSVALSEKMLRNYRKENLSLILRMYYLKDFRNAPVGDEVLAQISGDMEALRQAGMKAILRFSYAGAIDEPDAPLAVILQHLEQLKPVVRQNKDVIAVWQAGFIGAWGEWYYSTNHLNNDQARKAVLDKILDILPAGRCVQVRTPGYKQIYTGIHKAIGPEDAFGTKAIARIGHHNDCFMASADDYGTYQDADADKEYLAAEGLYVPMGGETCPPDGVDPADCAKAQAEMRRLRWSYLNRDYYRGVIDNWEMQGCMNDIIRDMGYRLSLQKGEYSTGHAPGSELSVALQIQNLGYAPLFNPRKVELVLRSASGETCYTALLPDDPRTWQPGKVTGLNAKIALPADLAPGDYKLYLFLPDPEPALHDRPEFAVRLANLNCWDETTGYNDLGVHIRVDADAALPRSHASVRFTSKR